MATNLIIFGAPGAGKGTQAALLCEELALRQLSTGELLRAEIIAATPLGKEIEKIVAEGTLCGDDLVIGLLKGAMAKSAGGVILDGFPRTIVQAEKLEEMFAATGRHLTAALYLNLAEEELLDRIAGRLSCSDCGTVYHKTFNPPKIPNICDNCGGNLRVRKDDNPESVKTRLKAYNRQTMPLLEFYRAKSVLKEIDGRGRVEEVAARLRRALGRGRTAAV